jgi:hypothetical protein
VAVSGGPYSGEYIAFSLPEKILCATDRRPIMSDTMPVGQKEREAETAEAKKDEGSGTVPNVTPGQDKDDETEELKEAMHQVEEEKGDWSKGR